MNKASRFLSGIVVLVTTVFFSFSCKEQKNPIPVARVYLNLDLTFEDKALKAVPSYKIYTAKDVNIALGERAGYGGVLVVHTHLDEYKAFDLACPFEAKPSVTVE
ncbi:MAG: hypothetical protein LBT42_00815, partial [Tannerella sp.]|nr:hypothetical protein [Tannerella sp.]